MKKIATLLAFVLIIALNSFASGITGSLEPLSLGLVSFHGYAKGSQVVLEWEAMSWATSRVFTIERSADGIRWTTIQEVAAKAPGTSNAQYAATDANPLKGNGYYRIGLSNDMGEQAVSSAIKVFSEGAAAGFSMAPNPCTEHLQIAGLSSGSAIIVRSSAGVEVFRGSADERTSINTGSWQPGMYFISIATPDGRMLQSRIVRR